MKTTYKGYDIYYEDSYYILKLEGQKKRIDSRVFTDGRSPLKAAKWWIDRDVKHTETFNNYFKTMAIKPIHKLNNGLGATLCHRCSKIISLGHTKDLYCSEECKNKHTNKK